MTDDLPCAAPAPPRAAPRDQLRHRHLWAVVLMGAVGIYVLLTCIDYRHPEALALAGDFVTHLQAGEVAAAWRLTTTGMVASAGTPVSPAFAAAIDREWRRAIGSATAGMPVVIAVRPRQTWGNRLRRWLLGRSPAPDQVSVDFRIPLVGAPRPPVGFEVQVLLAGGPPRVRSFQSHAW